MSGHYYNTKKDEAISVALNCPISLKFSVELAREIKNKPVSKVIPYLDDVIALKRHVPLKRYNRDVAHRKGQAISGVKSGRYPVNVAKQFKKIILSAVSNADDKGLDKDNLLLIGAVVTKGHRRMKVQPLGRRRTRLSKATNVELLVKEMRLKKISKADPKKTEAKKTEVKKVEAKPVKKVETKDVEAKPVTKKTTRKIVDKKE